MKKSMILAVALVLLVLLSGCSSKIDLSKMSENTVVAFKDGSIGEVSIETFDASYYNVADLRAFIEEAAAVYNAGQAEDDLQVDIRSIEETEGSVRVEILFASSEVYADFYDMALDLTDLEGLKRSSGEDGGIDLNTLTDGKSDTAPMLDELKNPETYQVLITKAAMNLRVEGKIRYYSQNVELIDKNHAKTTDELSVLIFK